MTKHKCLEILHYWTSTELTKGVHCTLYNPEQKTYLFEALGWGWGWGSTSVVLPSWSSIKIPVQYRVDCRVESVPAIVDVFVMFLFCSNSVYICWNPPNAQSWRLLIWACNLCGVKILIYQINEHTKHQKQIGSFSVCSNYYDMDVAA